MVKRLSVFEVKMKTGREQATRSVEYTKKLARDHNVKVQEARDNLQPVEHHFNLE